MPGKRVPEEERREQILRAALRVATRERLDGLTIRMVAAEAGISPGLVFFHYTNKDELLHALLQWLLQRTLVAEVGPDILAHANPAERLLALVRQEISRVAHSRTRLELFFDYWVIGSRNPAIQELIRAALDRYRLMFQPFAAAVIEQAPQRFAGASPEGLSMLIVSLIEGYTIQTIKDHGHSDPEPLLLAISTVLGPLEVLG